jgi:CubicO group peptidase (beta-lactamase class C family)
MLSMSRSYLSLLGMLLLVFVAQGQTLQTTGRSSKKVLTLTKPEEAGFSAGRLQRIDRVIQEYIDKQRIPGAVVLIARHGNIAYYKAFGKNDVESGDAMARDAIFRIASQTKAITSTAVMMLYEEGRSLLDEPVSKYIPEFKNPKVLSSFNEKDSSYTTVPAKSEITIRQLLTHTSGIGYGVFDPKQLGAIHSKAKYHEVPVASSDHVLRDQIRQLAKMPLLHQPGEKWTYGMNIDVLGYLVEVVSGLSLKDFLQQRLFDPLGMKDTYFYLPKEKGSRLTSLYQEDQSGKAVKYAAQYTDPGLNLSADFPLMANGKYYAGGGGLSSTAMDYAIFLQMMLNKGEYKGKRLLSRHTVEMMTMNQIGNLSLGEDKFGLGFSVATALSSARSPVSPGTFGWGGIFGTNYWADPQEGILALILTQVYPTSHVGNLHEKFQVLVYQAIME